MKGKSTCPQEWMTECWRGATARQIAAKFGVEDWRVVHRALLDAGAYRR